MRVGGVVHTWPIPWWPDQPLTAALLDAPAMDAATLALSYDAPAELAALLPTGPPALPRTTLFGDVAVLRGCHPARPLHPPNDARTDARYVRR